jgi:Domain of unknown function (DUF4252)
MKRSGYIMALALLPMMALAQAGRIKLPDFSKLSEKASKSVDISLDKEMLGTAGAFMGRGEDPAFAAVVAGLEGVFVRVLNFDKPDMYSSRDIEAVVKQVETQGWKKLLSVREKGEQVEMWMRDNNVDGGMLFVAMKPTELVLINIAGKVNLEQLRQLQGRMGVPFLPPEVGGGRPAPPPPATPAR